MPASLLVSRRRRRIAFLAPVAVATTAALAGLAAVASGAAGASPALHHRPTLHLAGSPVTSHALPPAVSGPSAAALAARTGVRASAEATATAWVTINGHGDGHGRGMGQWGAFGYAALPAYDWSANQILAHYYGGTTLEQLAPGVASRPVEVNLSELDWANVTVVRAARAGAGISVNGGRTRNGTVRVRHNGGTQTIRASAGDVSVQLPGVGWRAFRGYLQVQPDGQTWNIVGLRAYLDGVVPSESPAGWGAVGGEAALEAQAVAARSYALAYIADVGFTCDSTACQDYTGDPARNASVGADVVYSNEAVVDTAGEVLCTVAGTSCPAADIAFSEYSASTGGWSAGGQFPAVVDSGDAVSANPIHDWSIPFTQASIQATWPSIGQPTSITVTSRNGYGQWGGRAATVVVTGQSGSVTMTGDQFAADLGLYSDWFTVVPATATPVTPPTTPPTTTPTTAPSSTSTTVGGSSAR